MAVWYSLRTFGIFSPFWYVWKNLATLRTTAKKQKTVTTPNRVGNVQVSSGGVATGAISAVRSFFFRRRCHKCDFCDAFVFRQAALPLVRFLRCVRLALLYATAACVLPLSCAFLCSATELQNY
jgi:hypothetical protein